MPHQNVVTRPSYINNCLKVKHPLCIFITLCSCCYTAKKIKNCMKSTFVTKVATMKKMRMVSHAPVKGAAPINYCPKYYVSLSTIFNSLHSNTNQDLVEKRLCIQSSHCEKYGQFHITHAKEAITCNQQISTLFTVSEDEWNTKEDTGKSLKNALHVLRCAKRHLSG